MDSKGHSAFFWAAVALVAWLLYRAWRKPAAVVAVAAAEASTTVEAAPDVAPATSVPIVDIGAAAAAPSVETLTPEDLKAKALASWRTQVESMSADEQTYMNQVPYVSVSGRTLGPLYDSWTYRDTQAYADPDVTSDVNERHVIGQILDRGSRYTGN